MVRSGDTTPTIVRYVRKDGSITWAEVKLNPFYAGTAEHELVGVDGVVREVANPTMDAAKGVRVAAGSGSTSSTGPSPSTAASSG